MSAPEHTRRPLLSHASTHSGGRIDRLRLGLLQVSTSIRLLDTRALTRTSNRSSWISWFLSSKGNEYFCEVEEDYILDRFNLTGLNTEVQNYTQALDLITDNLGA